VPTSCAAVRLELRKRNPNRLNWKLA